MQTSVVILLSVRLVEGERLDWRLFRVSDQSLVKWFGKSCPLFGFHLNCAMPTSLPASIVYIQQAGADKYIFEALAFGQVAQQNWLALPSNLLALL